MKSHYIDSYHYCDKNDEEKEKFYREHVASEEEKIKTSKLMEKLEDFVIKTDGADGLDYFYYISEAGRIRYRDGLGYISVDNYDRDEVIIYGYGKTVEEAFITATIDYELYVCGNYECNHRQELNKQFSERFLDGNYSKKDYHGPFFFAELALQNFRKYYGDNIPEEIINHYENYLREVGLGDYKYDYEANRLVKNVEKSKIYFKK